MYFVRISYKFIGDKIPPKSTLVFDIELVTIQDPPQQMPPPDMPYTPPPMRNVFKDIDTNSDKQLTREEVGLLHFFSDCLKICTCLSDGQEGLEEFF